MAEVIQSHVRKISFSSDISDLPPTDDIDERIAKIKEAIQKSEIKRQIRQDNFRIRFEKCVERIDNLEEKQVERLEKEGIIISLEKVKAEASILVQKQKEIDSKRSQKVYERQIREIQTPQNNESPSQTEVNEWPQNATEENVGKSKNVKTAETIESEKFVSSVTEELAKLNLLAKPKKTKSVANKKDAKNKESKVLPDLKDEKPLRVGGRRGSLQQDATDMAKILQRRGSLTMPSPLNGNGGGRRKSITMETPDKKYLERRRSSLRTPPEWLQKTPATVPVNTKNQPGKEKKKRR